MEELDVGQVIIAKQIENSANYLKFKEIVNLKHINVVIVEKGKRIVIEDELYLDVLWPDENNLIEENGLNNNSIVCKLQFKDFSMLFTGDIEESAEKLMLSENINIKADVLKVAHHRFKNIKYRKIY